MNASLKGLEDGVIFAKGHVLDAAMAAQVSKGKIGRMLPPAEAAALHDFEDFPKLSDCFPVNSLVPQSKPQIQTA